MRRRGKEKVGIGVGRRRRGGRKKAV